MTSYDAIVRRKLMIIGWIVSISCSVIGCRGSHEPTASPTAPSIQRYGPATSYEHQDHENLPVGTRIYYIGTMRQTIRPGENGPPGRNPDIVIVP